MKLNEAGVRRSSVHRAPASRVVRWWAALHTVALFVLLLSLANGCATGGIPAGAIAVRVECNVTDATVWIDDKLAGKVSDWPRGGVRLRAGFHRIEVRHPGHYSYFQEIEAKSGDDVRVYAQLRELLE